MIRRAFALAIMWVAIGMLVTPLRDEAEGAALLFYLAWSLTIGFVILDIVGRHLYMERD